MESYVIKCREPTYSSGVR